MLTVDNTLFHVHVTYPSLVNSFEIREGDNSGFSQNGREIRDIIGTAYSYELKIEPNPLFPADFDALWDVFSAPVASHTVSLPFGQSMKDFDMAVSDGERTYYGKSGGFHRWKGMTIKFRPIKPQREQI